MNIYIGASSGDIIGFLHTEADFSGDYKAQSANKVYKIECKGQEPHQNNQCVFVFEVFLSPFHSRVEILPVIYPYKY